MIAHKNAPASRADRDRDDLEAIAKALSSPIRLKVLDWLRDPEANFDSRREGDLSRSGACVSLIAHKAAISQPTASRHLEVLRRAGLVGTERVAQWNFHHRDEAGLSRARDLLAQI